jgi:hypothetical protein
MNCQILYITINLTLINEINEDDFIFCLEEIKNNMDEYILNFDKVYEVYKTEVGKLIFKDFIYGHVFLKYKTGEKIEFDNDKIKEFINDLFPNDIKKITFNVFDFGNY